MCTSAHISTCKIKVHRDNFPHCSYLCREFILFSKALPTMLQVGSG